MLSDLFDYLHAGASVVPMWVPPSQMFWAVPICTLRVANETAHARVHAGLSRQARARAGLAAFSHLSLTPPYVVTRPSGLGYTLDVNPPPILLGTSSFTASGWDDVFYPKGMRSANYFSFYAEHFHTVEVDSTPCHRTRLVGKESRGGRNLGTP